MPEYDINSTPIISVSHLGKWYGDFPALVDVSLDVSKGQKIVLCGPSGSGKSTLIRCIARLEDHQEGTLFVVDKERQSGKAASERLNGQVGMVFQHFNLFPHLTVLENCTLAPRLVKKLSEQDAEAIAIKHLEKVKIGEKATCYPPQLSGGQQQRAAIARALCMNPTVLLFDEPTSALDPEMVSEVLDTMVSLAEEGVTMICVTHEMGFAKRVADLVVFMADGKIVEVSKPQEFFAAPQHPRAQLFVRQISGH
ncbi:amino acid ABC transporter ATP-binding protein [Mesorhizobium sophorae]|uniref:amino acid ABC transporter ATP-binding protein n=1 Tax=Mesorhizobium sophorae TaxID=1300294 RepID=UPI000BA2CC52|nr:amino acid ABC transporter ATP-binding protein [Mesorhizobium sophorae]